MNIKELHRILEKELEKGNALSDIHFQRNDKCDLPTGDYQEPIRVNVYDDGIALIVDAIVE